MKLIFLVLLNFSCFIAAIDANDWVITFFNRISNLTNPCDDFFRSVCPITRFRVGIDDMASEDLEKIISEQGDKPWNHLQVQEDLRNVFDLHGKQIQGNGAQVVADKLYDLCVRGENTSTYLGIIEQLYGKKTHSECYNFLCVTNLAKDENCTRVAEKLKTVINTGSTLFNFTNFPFLDARGEDNLLKYQSAVRSAAATSHPTIRRGIKIIEDMVEKMKKIAIEQAKVTPWLVNTESVDTMVEIINQVIMPTDFVPLFEKYSKILYNAENTYLKCRNKLSGDDYAFVLVCGHLAGSSLSDYPGSNKGHLAKTFEDINASNLHPALSFGLPLYYYAGSESSDMASILGFVGYVVGHELGHTIVEDYAPVDNLVPYFSNRTRDCIQNQYESTCESFNEQNCTVSPGQIDENGADIFGLKLAYELLKQHYGDRINDLHPFVNLTYHQLFFFAGSVFACSTEYLQGKNGPLEPNDPHSSGNVRANVIVQISEFQEVFQCSDDSRMIQSRAEICHILGKDAYDTR